MMTLDRGRFRGSLLGLAVGDALGTTVEFSLRGTFEPLPNMPRIERNRITLLHEAAHQS